MSLLLAHRLRRFAWIAFVAIFGLVFAPTISRALAQGGSPWSAVCTAQGSQLLSLDDSRGDTPVPQTSTGHLDHCPLCGLSAMAVLPPPLAPNLALRAGLRDAVPVLFLHAPRPLFAWHQAQPRAPPLFA